MNQSNNSDKVTLQVTVGQLTLLSQLPEHLTDIRVTVSIDNVTKMTCSGDLSSDGQIVTWDHPFLFTALPFAPVVIAICALPEKLTLDWGKVPLGVQISTDVTTLLESPDGWKCDISILHDTSVSLFMACKACKELNTLDGHDCVSSQWQYASGLFDMNKQYGNISAITIEIEIEQALLDLCPISQANHISILNNIALAFSLRYDALNHISDLNRNIEIRQKLLDLCPPNHPDHAEAIGAYATSLWKLYWVQGNIADLDEAIKMGQKRLDLCPPNHSDHHKALTNLAIYLENRFRVQRERSDLDKAVEMAQKAFDLCPANQQNFIVIENLALALQARFYEEGNLADLEKVIELKERQLDLCPIGHTHINALQSLANSLKDHYKATKACSGLIRATKLLKESLTGCPVYHINFPIGIYNLAETILLTLEVQSSDESQDMLKEAFDTYELLKSSSPAVSMPLWDAIQYWISDAEKHNHPSALGAYQTSLNVLDHSISIQASVNSRHEAIQAKVANLANDAFSCALRHDNLQIAVELLEQGRGILWNQLARFDISLAALEHQGDHGSMLANKLNRLNANLRRHTQGSGGKGTDPYWRIHEEWKAVVDEIRRQEGFSRFLLPPQFDDLQRAAECGPVIIVNVSKYNCDALIVLDDRPPVHIPLNCSFEDIDDLCSQFSKLIQDPRAYGTHRESWIKQSLSELWSSVVGPIVRVLQNDLQLPIGSRIWWYPTSSFTSLPFHAAGPYRKDEKNLVDIYISSYAPSLSALIRARERVRSQKIAREGFGTANVISFAAVGQAHPSADLNLPHLPEVEHEIRRIRDEVSGVPDALFEVITGSAATIEGAVQAFQNHRWVHIACHGAQHAEKPFESWFAMGDGKLTLMRIIQERYTHSEFAFLSACHTAVGNESTPDEVIHLAAGMQFGGFNGVIGTLWKVDDSIVHQVVTEFYREMFKQQDVDFEHAATALNAAVVESADKVPLENRIVFVHIGI